MPQLRIPFDCLRCLAPVRVTAEVRRPVHPDPTEPVEWALRDDEKPVQCSQCGFPHGVAWVHAHHAINGRVQEEAAEHFAGRE